MKHGFMIALTLLVIVGCRPDPPESTVGVIRHENIPASSAETDEGAPPERADTEPTSGPERDSGTPPVTAIIGELTATITAALSGGDLPEVSFRLPGTRGEQVVQVGSDGWPEGEVVAVASMIKIDVTLEGCGSDGGLTIGLLQSQSGIHVIGLGDQFQSSTTPAPESLGEVVAATESVLNDLRQGAGSDVVFQAADCEADFGSAELCGRIFPAIPEEATLSRYQQMLATCDASPVISVPLISLWLRDESGTSFQGLVRMSASEGRQILSDPIMIASGLR